MATTTTARRCSCTCPKSAHRQNNSHRTAKGACRRCPCGQYEPEPDCALCDLPVSACECCDTCGEPPQHCECHRNVEIEDYDDYQPGARTLFPSDCPSE